MKKSTIIGLVIITLVVGLGLGYLFFNSSANLGAAPSKGQVEVNPFWFVNGVTFGTAGTTYIDKSGNTNLAGTLAITGALSGVTSISTGNTFSSSSPAAMGSKIAGGFVIAAGQTTVGVSTTAVTANSNILVQYDPTITVAGLTCNTAVNASTTWAISARTAGVGFTVKVASTPVTNPFCFTYLLTN